MSAWAVPLISVVLGAVLATLFGLHRDRRRGKFELKAAIDAETRQRCFEAHAEVIGKLQAMQRQLDDAFLARRRRHKRVATPWLDIASLDPLRGRLAVVAGPDSLQELDYAVKELLAERRAFAAGHERADLSGMTGAGAATTIRSYIEFVRIELGQPVRSDEELSDRWLAAGLRDAAAERKAEKARQEEAAIVAEIGC